MPILFCAWSCHFAPEPGAKAFPPGNKMRLAPAKGKACIWPKINLPIICKIIVKIQNFCYFLPSTQTFLATTLASTKYNRPLSDFSRHHYAITMWIQPKILQRKNCISMNTTCKSHARKGRGDRLTMPMGWVRDMSRDVWDKFTVFFLFFFKSSTVIS